MIHPIPTWWRLAWPLRVTAAPAYWLGLKTHQTLYQLGIKRRYRPPVPVICVGNLSTGGTGKTPVVVSIVRMLQGMGKTVGILTRGYKSGRKKVTTPGRARVTPRDVGDEPFLLTEKLTGAHVLISPNRAASARVAVEQIGCDVLVMDDGFQHWALERDLDVVLIDAGQPVSLNHLMPWGNLREGHEALRRAQVVVITKAASEAERRRLADEIRRAAPSIAVWQADFVPSRIYRIADGKQIEAAALKAQPVIVVCGIARPHGFEQTVWSLGCRVERRFFYRDHFVYPDLVIRYLELQAGRLGARCLLTTEKDAVKLRGRVAADSPWAVVEIETAWLDPPAEQIRQFLEQSLAKRSR